MRRFLWGIFFIFCAVRLAHAWNAEGHMVVAQIAYNHLDPAVKTRCDALVAISVTGGTTSNNTFVTAACWADDAKSALGTGIWHYIDQPLSLDGSSTATAYADLLATSMDVVRAERLCEFMLQSTTATDTQKAPYFRYLLHFTGDIHQPLHCATGVTSASPDGDAGGNSFSIKGTWSELHALWDAGGGLVGASLARPLTSGSQTTLNNLVTSIEAQYPYTDHRGSIPDPQLWATEGLAAARTVSYVGITENATPSTTYLNNAQAKATERLAAGGHRLADLLNTIFASSATPTPTPTPTATATATPTATSTATPTPTATATATPTPTPTPTATPTVQTFELDITAPDIEAVTGSASAIPAELAVDNSGNVILWDNASNKLIRMLSDGTTGIVLATQVNINTAINAANGTDGAPPSGSTGFRPSTIQMSADGDVVMLGLCTVGAATNVEQLLSVANTANGTIKVISTPVSSGINPIDGANDFCMNGNTAVITEDNSFGSTEDRLITLDTNSATIPTPTVTVLSVESQLNSAFGVAAHALKLGPIVQAPDGNYWVCDSNASGTSDNWVEVNATTGAAALLVNKSNTLTGITSDPGQSPALTATDVGYCGATVAASGDLYTPNQFGAGTSLDGVVELSSPAAGNATTFIRSAANILADCGSSGSAITFGDATGTNDIAFSPSDGRVYLSISAPAAITGVISVSADSPLPVELSRFEIE